MTSVPFALYDAFSDAAFGGSPAGIVSDAAGLDPEIRQKIAREIGAPATGFVTAHDATSISAHFHSTKREYPMCGHGTVCLVTRMIELGLIDGNEGGRIAIELRLPSATAAVEITRREDGRPLVLLDIAPPSFRMDPLDTGKLAGLLGITKEHLHPEFPLETARGDFVHLVVPVTNLDAMRRIKPDFGGLADFCRDHGIETIAAFCTGAERPGHSLHVRDFCPAVGVAESAAAGTTNAALICYLIRHGIVRANSAGRIVVEAEQGLEIGRPSSVRSVASMKDGAIGRLQVGGIATRILEGELQLPRTGPRI